MSKSPLSILAAILLFCGPALSQSAAKADVVVFANGDQLSGELISATNDKILFKSAMAGEIKLDWSNIKELKTAGPYAVVVNQKLVQTGVLTLSNPTAAAKQIVVTTSAAEVIVPPDPNLFLIDQATYFKETTAHPGFFQDWTGTATAGLSFIRATQNQSSFNGALALVRTVPGVSWLDPRNRTLVNFTGAFGKTTEPGTPDVKTEIYHADAERDKYLSKRPFALGVAAFDHNFSQGLRFQQAYGVGVGYTLLDRPNQKLDLRADLRYTRESFYINSNDANLIGSQLSESYLRKLPHAIVFTEKVSVTPSFNMPSAYQVNGNAALALPLYKKFDLTLGLIDSYLNNPSPGSKKNSVQFTTGLQYVFP